MRIQFIIGVTIYVIYFLIHISTRTGSRTQSELLLRQLCIPFPPSGLVSSRVWNRTTILRIKASRPAVRLLWNNVPEAWFEQTLTGSGPVVLPIRRLWINNGSRDRIRTCIKRLTAARSTLELLWKIRAGDVNRTRIIWLEARHSTIGSHLLVCQDGVNRTRIAWSQATRLTTRLHPVD